MTLARLTVVAFAVSITLTVSIRPAAAETSCKSSFLGFCTSRYTPDEQEKIDALKKAKIDADKRFQTLLKDPVGLFPELEGRLRKQVRYESGTLVIKEELTDTIKTFPSTVPWSVSCGVEGISVDFGDVSENGNGISLNLTDYSGMDTSVCQRISGPLGAAVLRLTRGQ